MLKSTVRNFLLQLFNIVVFDDKATECVSTLPLINTGVLVINSLNQPIYQIDAENAALLYVEKALVKDRWKNTFHKTWEKVANSDIEQLIFEQLVHYMLTYGMEAMGLTANPWIPVEEAFAGCSYCPENIKGFSVVRIVSEKEAINIFSDYCKVAKAIKSGYTTEMAELMSKTELKPEDIISNELRSIRYKQLNLVPQDGQEFLRYIIYETTGMTLVIKNRTTIDSIKKCAAGSNKYFEKADLVELSKVFLRNKELFLAFKAEAENRPIINKIRRLAEKNHKPMSPYTIQNIANLTKAGRFEAVNRLVADCNTRKLINLINYSNNSDTITKTYTVRNGKGFVADNTNTIHYENMATLENILAAELRSRLFNKLSGKTFFIPEYINYSAPTSEKQMLGNIPFGTSISTKSADAGFCLAIAWDNYQGERTDIDLHMTGDDGRVFGWNSRYRSDDRGVLYSGDMTDATDGAVEAFMFQPKDGDRYLISANNYTSKNGVPFKFLMTNNGFNTEIESEWDNTHQCCRVEDAIFAPIPLKFKDTNDTSIGILDGNTFYFYGGTFGQGVVPSHELYKTAVGSLCSKLKNQIHMKSLLELAGARVVHTIEPDVIDLSPAALTEQTLLNIIDSF